MWIRDMGCYIGEPLEADHWLRVMESKFGLLCCTKVRKTLFAVQ
jgi:hypothetical protein